MQASFCGAGAHRDAQRARQRRVRAQVTHAACPPAMLKRRKRSASSISISRKFASLGQTLATSGERCAGAAQRCRAPRAASATRSRGRGERIGLERAQRRFDGGLGERVGRDDASARSSIRSGCAISAPMRAPASACALESVRSTARVEKRSSQAARLRAAGPFDVGLIHHHDGLAVERGAHRLEMPRASKRCRWDCWASTGTPVSCAGARLRAAAAASRLQPRPRSSGTSSTPAPWMCAATRYMPKVGGHCRIASVAGAQ